MIICYLHVKRVAILKPKAYSPLVIDGNGVLPNSIPPQPMKPIARRDPQVIHARSEIQIFQLSYRPLPYFWREPLRLTVLVQLFRTPVGKGLDHARSVMWCVTPVNPGLMLSAEGFADQTMTPHPFLFSQRIYNSRSESPGAYPMRATEPHLVL